MVLLDTIEIRGFNIWSKQKDLTSLLNALDCEHAHINDTDVFGVSVSYIGDKTVYSTNSGQSEGIEVKCVKDGVVLPINISSGVFATFDVDNLDSKN